MTTKLSIAQDLEADALLDREPLALLLGMLLDQQIPMEVAFLGPKKLADRMGKLDVRQIAEYDPAKFSELAATPPAIHRFPGSMAKRIQTLCRYIVEIYDGDTEAIWKQGDLTGAEVLKRLKALPGFGDQKAKIFLALLGKQRGLAAVGWQKAAGDYGESDARKSVADVVDAKSLSEVRSFKRAKKAAARLTN